MKLRQQLGTEKHVWRRHDGEDETICQTCSLHEQCQNFENCVGFNLAEYGINHHFELLGDEDSDND